MSTRIVEARCDIEKMKMFRGASLKLFYHIITYNLAIKTEVTNAGDA